MVAETADQVTIEMLEYDLEQKDEELAAMRQRAEEAESCLRDFVSILSIPHPVEPGTYKELLTTAFGHAKELLGMVPDPGVSPPADASTMPSDQPADPYSGELGNINLRNLAARMHAALGLLKRQGCYHPSMDSMREEGFKHGLNVGDKEPEDHIADASTMGGEAVSKMETTELHPQYRPLEPEPWGGPEGEE